MISATAQIWKTIICMPTWDNVSKSKTVPVIDWLIITISAATKVVNVFISFVEENRLIKKHGTLSKEIVDLGPQ